MPPKGELETVYGGPWGGLDYSRPYNALDPQFLAPGSVNTSQINGFLTSSPWLGSSPYNNPFAGNEWVIGISRVLVFGISTTIVTSFTVVVTNLAVYYTGSSAQTIPSVTPTSLNLLHTWAGGEVSASLMVPGNAASFVEVAGVLYFTALGLNGIFSVTASGSFPPTFAQATNYVSAANLIELGGRLVAAQCRFPGGGGTGTNVLPTVAWSGPGLYAGSGASDPWNPVNNLGGGFNELSDVPDAITGLAGIGRSALVGRMNGISQIDPNPGTSNSGLQPFTFYHLWASIQGIGAFPGTMAQYGSQVLFRSSDGVYSISIGSGLQSIGSRIIAKIIADQKTVDNHGSVVTTGSFAIGYWYFSSIVNFAGQLHYLLCFSSYNITVSGGVRVVSFTATVYDLNISEGGWHIWDVANAYLSISGATLNVLGFSCPVVLIADISNQASGGGTPQVQLGFHQFLFGGFTTFGANPTTYAPAGLLNQFVPLDYDFATNPIDVFDAPRFQPLALPKTNIVFRAEMISLGHKITTRRLRVQADNAPIPTSSGGPVS